MGPVQSIEIYSLMFKKSFYFLVTYFVLQTSVFAASLQLETKIYGITGPVLDNVQQRLTIAKKEYGDLSLADIEAFYQKASKNIQNAMEPYGYFRPKIQSHLIHRDHRWIAIFSIHAGPKLRVTSVNIDIEGPGEHNRAIIKYVKHFPIKVGQVFKTPEYENAKENLFQVANEQGYLKASLENKEVRIDLVKYRADISLKLLTGPRYYFGKVTFKQDTFSENFLKRFMGFQEGQPFSSEKLLAFQQNLSTSNYFRNISVTPLLQDSQDQIVPVDVSLIPNKSQQYSVGVGYGTFTGPRLTVSAKYRRLTDTGHHVDMQLKLSPVLSQFATQYVIPGANPITDQYTFGANLQKFAPKNGKSISGTLSMGAVKQFGNWKRTLTLSYLAERFNIEGEENFRNSGLLIPSADFMWMKSDDLLFPRYGNKIDFVVRGAARQFVSTTNFAQTEIKGKSIYSPSQQNRLIFMGDFGYTVVRDLDSLPLSLQFFAGGLDSVRGFPYSYFGPGRYLKVGSVEFQQHLYGNVWGAIFYDVGTADNHINSPMGHGQGLGIIYNSVVGPIKAYVGFGKLKGKPRHFDLEFSIGPDL